MNSFVKTEPIETAAAQTNFQFGRQTIELASIFLQSSISRGILHEFDVE